MSLGPLFPQIHAVSPDFFSPIFAANQRDIRTPGALRNHTSFPVSAKNHAAYSSSTRYASKARFSRNRRRRERFVPASVFCKSLRWRKISRIRKTRPVASAARRALANRCSSGAVGAGGTIGGALVSACDGETISESMAWWNFWALRLDS